MRILFLSQLLPFPLDAGPKIRAYYVLRYLAEAGHNVKLVCFTRPGDNDHAIDQLLKICVSVETIPLVRSRFKDITHGLHSLFSTTPFLILRDQLPSMRQKLAQITADCSFDAMHADQLWMSPYIMDHAGPTPKVLDQHNAVFMIPRRMAEHQRNRLTKLLLRNESQKLEAFERYACDLCDRVVWVTDEDRKAVDSATGRCSSHDSVIPIATDPSTNLPLRRSLPFRVTFVGGLHWPPNLEGVSWFVDKVWPKVSQAEPSAVLTLIGKGAPGKIFQEKCGSRIEVTGYVTHLVKYLCETAVFIVPLRSGAGMRVKILDAWCWGLPVVSTSMGAEGIATSPGDNLLIADDEEAFADCLLRVMQNGQLARQLSDNGRSTVSMLYDWRKVYKAWDQIYH
jgi:polysaccharide biosynthesis protein PslH